MDEKETEEAAILARLQKTGYPTEIIAGRAMQRRGWGVIHNPSYLDDTEHINREYDLRAFKQWASTEAQSSFSVGVYLMVQCKKSDSPWVFFTTLEEYRIDNRRLLRARYKTNPGLFIETMAEKEPLFSNDMLRDNHHYWSARSRGRTYTEPMKSKGQPEYASAIYGAVLSAVKAVLFEYNKDSDYPRQLHLYYPMVVFSGHMFEATIADDKSIRLEPIPLG